jgi:L-threonylcarbamoyladenylate synthase
MAIILSTSKNDIHLAANALREGLLVALPTETVYGLAADAGNRRAVAAIFSAKERPEFDPLIVHVSSPEKAHGVADFSDPRAQLLAESCWPGPLTLVLPRRDWVPDLVTSGLDTVAVRCPAHEVTRKIIEASGVAVAAPSANPFGRISPTTAEHVRLGLGERVDYIVDGGPCTLGVESTVVDLSADPPLVLRPGGLSVEELRELVPELELLDRSSVGEHPRAPGQLPRHYAPSKPLHLFPSGVLAPSVSESEEGEAKGFDLVPFDEPVGVLCFGTSRTRQLKASGRYHTVLDLSPKQNVIEAAANLFSFMHRLEASACRTIFAERLPDTGIGRAVNDRLYKASWKE